MNDEVLQSRMRISRRRAMLTGGAISLGGVLAACGNGAPSGGSNDSTGGSASPVKDIAALLDSAPTCTTTPVAIEGPFWFNVDDVRQDIREDRPGTPLTVALRVLDTSRCAAGGAAAPFANAVVEIWQCDAGGIYSGFQAPSATATPPPPGYTPPPAGTPSPFSDALGNPSAGSYSVGDTQTTPVDDATYLRGAQVTDSTGIAQFMTIFPGWYIGRTVHIHFKVHRDKATVLTAQMYFDETVIAAAHSVPPYSEHVGRDMTNVTDYVYNPDSCAVVETVSGVQVAALNVGIPA